MNFIFRAGGGLISSDEDNTVLLDHPNTIRGLELFDELGSVLGYAKNESFENHKPFCEGKVAFSISTRQVTPMLKANGMKDWNIIHLPFIPGGADITAQATDLLCIRKSCTDTETAVKLVSLVLSENFQNYLGNLKYGIPVRKSSALKSIDAEDPKDSIFILEAVKASAEYKIDSREIAQLISGGIKLALMKSQNIKTSMEEIASALRTILKIRRQSR
jgi:ABC-type glycerol-3-phosphate transport system substrate-binding protein